MEEGWATNSTEDTNLQRLSDRMKPVNVLHRVLFSLLMIDITASIAGKLQPGEFANEVHGNVIISEKKIDMNNVIAIKLVTRKSR